MTDMKDDTKSADRGSPQDSKDIVKSPEEKKRKFTDFDAPMDDDASQERDQQIDYNNITLPTYKRRKSPTTEEKSERKSDAKTQPVQQKTPLELFISSLEPESFQKIFLDVVQENKSLGEFINKLHHTDFERFRIAFIRGDKSFESLGIRQTMLHWLNSFAVKKILDLQVFQALIETGINASTTDFAEILELLTNVSLLNKKNILKIIGQINALSNIPEILDTLKCLMQATDGKLTQEILDLVINNITHPGGVDYNSKALQQIMLGLARENILQANLKTVFELAADVTRTQTIGSAINILMQGNIPITQQLFDKLLGLSNRKPMIINFAEQLLILKYSSIDIQQNLQFILDNLEQNFNLAQLLRCMKNAEILDDSSRKLLLQAIQRSPLNNYLNIIFSRMAETGLLTRDNFTLLMSKLNQLPRDASQEFCMILSNELSKISIRNEAHKTQDTKKLYTELVTQWLPRPTEEEKAAKAELKQRNHEKSIEIKNNLTAFLRKNHLFELRLWNLFTSNVTDIVDVVLLQDIFAALERTRSLNYSTAIAVAENLDLIKTSVTHHGVFEQYTETYKKSYPKITETPLTATVLNAYIANEMEFQTKENNDLKMRKS